MKIEITNLLTNEKTLFVNDYTLSHNIISLILINEKQTGQILNKDARNKITDQYPIKEAESKITGRKFAYCESKDLHAKFIA